MGVTNGKQNGLMKVKWETEWAHESEMGNRMGS